MLQKIQTNIQIAVKVDEYNRATVEIQDIVHYGHRLQHYAHSDQQTCDQNQAIHVHRGFEIPEKKIFW